MTNNGLKPCPFCGNEKPKIIKPFDYIDDCYIYCRGCGMTTKMFDTEEKLRSMWNTRAITEVEVKVID